MKHSELNALVGTMAHLTRLIHVAFDVDAEKREAGWNAPLGEFISPSKEVAAVKRASMDLTRQLAQLRSRNK